MTNGAPISQRTSASAPPKFSSSKLAPAACAASTRPNATGPRTDRTSGPTRAARTGTRTMRPALSTRTSPSSAVTSVAAVCTATLTLPRAGTVTAAGTRSRAPPLSVTRRSPSVWLESSNVPDRTGSPAAFCSSIFAGVTAIASIASPRTRTLAPGCELKRTALSNTPPFSGAKTTLKTAPAPAPSRYFAAPSIFHGTSTSACPSAIPPPRLRISNVCAAVPPAGMEEKSSAPGPARSGGWSTMVMTTSTAADTPALFCTA